MDRDRQALANLEDIFMNNTESSRVSLYNKSKHLNPTNYKPSDVILSVASQLQALQAADRVKINKNRRKLCTKKSNFIPLCRLQNFDEDQPLTSNKFETQCVSDTQLLDLVRNAEEMPNPSGMTQEFDISFTHSHVACALEHHSDRNIVKKSNNNQTKDIYKAQERNDPESGSDMVDITLFKDSNEVLPVNNLLEVQTEMVKNDYPLEGSEEKVPNLKHETHIIESDVIDDEKENDIETMSPNLLCNFKDNFYSLNENCYGDTDTDDEAYSQISPSPILNLKSIKQGTTPLVYNLDSFEQFERIAMPLLTRHRDLKTVKRLINSQIFGKELIINEDIGFNSNEQLSQIIEIKSDKQRRSTYNSISDINRVDFLKAEYSINNDRTFINKCESAPISPMHNLIDEKKPNFDTDDKITATDIQSVSFSDVTPLFDVKKHQSETDLITDVNKSEQPKEEGNADYYSDEIIFSSDEEDCIPTQLEDLPFTCALETSFYEMSQILDKTMFVGFQTASNKSIQVHKDSFHKAKSILDDFDEKGLSITEMVKICDKTRVQGEVGSLITTEKTNLEQQPQDKAKDVDIIIEATQQTSQKIYNDSIYVVTHTVMGATSNSNQQHTPNVRPSFHGFKTASNKIIKLSEHALNRCREVFQHIDMEDDFDFEIGHIEDLETTNVEMTKTGVDYNIKSNTDSKITENSAKSENNAETDFIHENINDDVLIQEFENIEMSLEDSCHNSKKDKDDIKVEQLRDIYPKNEFKNIVNICSNKASDVENYAAVNIHQFKGFKTANNKHIQVSKDALAKTKSIFKDIDCFDIKAEIRSNVCKEKGQNSETNICKPSTSKTNLSVKIKNEAKHDDSENGDYLCVGFKTAANKNIIISKEAMDRSKKIMEDIKKDSDMNLMPSKNNTKTSRESLSPARNVIENVINVMTAPKTFHFQTASNKTVKVSEEAPADSKALFINTDRNEYMSSVTQKQMSTPFKGFSTASNKPVSISKEALAKSKKLFQDVDINENCSSETNNGNLNEVKPFKFLGFSTASKKPVMVSEQALSESKKLFQDLDSINVANEPIFNGFKTASDKVDMKGFSVQALVQCKNMFEGITKDCNENYGLSTRNKAEKGTNVSFQGFSTASNKPVLVSKEALLKSKKLFEGIDLNECKGNPVISKDENLTDSSSNFKGFSTASNKPVIVSEKALLKSKKMFDDINTCNENSTLLIKNRDQIAPNKTFQPFSTVGEAVTESKQIFQDVDATNENLTKIRTKCDPFKTASNKEVIINVDALAESKKKFRDLDNAISERECIDNKLITHAEKANFADIDSRSFKRLGDNNEAPDLIQITNKNKKDTNKIQKGLSVEMLDVVKTNKDIEILIDTQVFKDFDAKLYTNDFQTTPRRNKRSGSPILSCPRAKKRKFETPYLNTKVNTEIIEHKTIVEKSHYYDDNYKKNKKFSLKDLLTMEKENTSNRSKTLNIGLEFDDLLNFKFTNERCDISNTVRTIEDIKELFLKSVNPKLIPDNWLDNHLKLILWKLISYEIKFPSILEHVCSAKNVLRQLKYRYDKELYEAKRPALRLILEKDDVPSRTMVLCVVSVFIDGVEVHCPTKPENLELLVTDGWYCLRCTVDRMLARLVCDGRLTVGDKMVTTGAELIDCKGVSPWEDTSSVRLKIFGNSTRKARWDARLGYQNTSSMTVPLSTVKIDGGKVANLTVYVTRLYPALYVEKFEDGSTVTRSERLEHLHQLKHESEKQIVLEKIYEVVEKEFNDQDSQDTDSPIEPSNKKICYETGSQIARMMKTSKDPVEFKHTLTSSQLALLNQYSNCRREKALQDVKARVRAKMAASGVNIIRNVVPVLKARVAGVYRGVVTAGMLSVWKPSDAVQEILSEGTWIDVMNVVPTAFRYGEIQISAGRQSAFKQSKVKEIEKNNLFTKSLNRICHCIKELAKNPSTDYNEIDTFGMVFLIDPSMEEFESRNQSFQNVYLTDAEKNLLSVNFWGGVKKFGFENILDTGQIVACANLQKRAGNTRKSIPQYRATEYSHFTKTPKNHETRNLIKDLEIYFASVNKTLFFEECTALKNNICTNRYVNNENISPYRFNNSDYCLRNNKAFIETPLANKNDEFTLTGLDFESTFQQSEEQLSPRTLERKKKVNERITKLKMYGEPPPLSPIHMINKSKTACNSYKSPLISKSDVSNSVTSVQKANGSSNKNCQEQSINCSPVITFNKKNVKRSKVNPTKLIFSHNISKENESLGEI